MILDFFFLTQNLEEMHIQNLILKVFKILYKYLIYINDNKECIIFKAFDLSIAFNAFKNNNTIKKLI